MRRAETRKDDEGNSIATDTGPKEVTSCCRRRFSRPREPWEELPSHESHEIHTSLHKTTYRVSLQRSLRFAHSMHARATCWRRGLPALSGLCILPRSICGMQPEQTHKIVPERTEGRPECKLPTPEKPLLMCTLFRAKVARLPEIFWAEAVASSRKRCLKAASHCFAEKLAETFCTITYAYLFASGWS